jgi:hypothetical protein
VHKFIETCGRGPKIYLVWQTHKIEKSYSGPIFSYPRIIRKKCPIFYILLPYGYFCGPSNRLWCTQSKLFPQIHKYTVPNTRKTTTPPRPQIPSADVIKGQFWWLSFAGSLYDKYPCSYLRNSVQRTPNQIQRFFPAFVPDPTLTLYCSLFGLRRVTWYSCVVYILCTACLIEDPFRKKPGRGVPCMMHHPSVHDTSCMVVSWLVLCTHKDTNGLSLAFSTLSRWIVFDRRSTPTSMYCTVTAAK